MQKKVNKLFFKIYKKHNAKKKKSEFFFYYKISCSVGFAKKNF